MHNNNVCDTIIGMGNTPKGPYSPFESRVLALQKRVNDAALALHERGLKPTVARVRAALGGGSPNDLGPAVKHWKEEVLPSLLTPLGVDGTTVVPAPVADLARELWTRAVAAASVDRRGGERAIQLVARSEEVTALKQQIASMRDQIDRDAVAYGELRALAARHEMTAKAALDRVRESDERERKALRQLGDSRQRIAELEARVDEATSRPRQMRKSVGVRPVLAKRTARHQQRKVSRSERSPKKIARNRPKRIRTRR